MSAPRWLVAGIAAAIGFEVFHGVGGGALGAGLAAVARHVIRHHGGY